MAEVVVEADPSHGGGHALIRVRGGATSGLANPRFRLSRQDYEAGTLGPGGWQVADTLLAPLAARADGADLVLSVGPLVVDRIESGVVTLAVPSVGFDAPVFWPELPLSRGGRGSVRVAVAPPNKVLPKPLVGQQKADPSATPPASEAEPKKSSWDRIFGEQQGAAVEPMPPPPVRAPPPILPLRLLAALAVLILLVGGGGVWWALQRPAPPEVDVPPPHVPVLPPDCLQGSVAVAVACAPDTDALYTEGQRRWDAGQVDQGLILMQLAADRGSGAAELKLAQLYDPDTFQAGGPIPRPNAREAAKYYRLAVRALPEAATGPRAALRERLQNDADNGDTLAGLTLKDFWP